MAKSQVTFPKRFLWGASISAHQVEGGNHNQWTVWELENAKTLAAQAEYQFGDLDNWSKIAKQAKSAGNYVSNRASDHYRRYEEDFDALKGLNMNSLRFSIEWSRLEPEEGAWDAAAIDYYRRYFSALRQRKITPVVTLFHFTLPVWFSEKGGFLKRSNIKYFLRFVENVIDEFGSEMRLIITINEPEVYAYMSYKEGLWPPQVQSTLQMMRVINNLIIAHNRAARIIHDSANRYKVSMAYHLSYLYAGDDARLSSLSTWAADYARNRAIMQRTIKNNDFIAVNYYFSERIYGYRTHNPNERVSDMGWDMQPYNLRYVLEDLADRYDLPIIITENGLADARDEHRGWWLAQTIEAIYDAMKSGVSVTGYIHWSLLDNFEWDKGFWPRFGLLAVDYATMKRTPRASAKALARTIANLRGR